MSDTPAVGYTVFRHHWLGWELHDDGKNEVVLFIYGAPPVSDGADFFNDVP